MTKIESFQRVIFNVLNNIINTIIWISEISWKDVEVVRHEFKTFYLPFNSN